MKIPLLVLGTSVLILAANAQTNAPDPDLKKEGAEGLPQAVVQTNTIIIDSDSFSFNRDTRIAIYSGNVRVKDPQVSITCDILTVHVPLSDKADKSDKPDSIIAEHNVVIDAKDNEGRPVQATCDKAVYTYQASNLETNRTIVLTGSPLTGDPQVKSQIYSGSGEKLTWDIVNNTIVATNNVHMGGTLVHKADARQQTNSLPAISEKK